MRMKRTMALLLCFAMLLTSPVAGIAATGVPALNKTAQELSVGKKFTLKVKNYTGKVTWSSGKPAVAQVSKAGVVSAKKAGKATITATLKKTGKVLKCTVTVSKTYSQEQITKKIMALQDDYPEGMKWTNDNFYFWSAIYCNCYGCIAFAGEVSDKVFGVSAGVTRHTDFDKIKAGDHVRVGDYHSMIVISKEGDTLTVVEGNFNSSVHWGRKITKQELLSESGFYVDTRY